MAGKRSSSSPRKFVSGKCVTSVCGFYLVEDEARKCAVVQTVNSESASKLAPKLARALGNPGVGPDMVFRGMTRNVYSPSTPQTRREWSAWPLMAREPLGAWLTDGSLSSRRDEFSPSTTRVPQLRS